MMERFEEIFWQVGEEHGYKHWWEIFDSELMNEVDIRIAAEFGELPEEYIEWCDEMARDL